MALRSVPGPADEIQERCPLGKCDGSGFLVDEETNTARPCDCRADRIRRAGATGVGMGIGRRFLEVSFDREPIVSIEPTILRHVRSFVGSIERNLDAGRGLWFDGPVGTGKTSLAILVAKAARDAGRSYAVYPVPRLLAEIKRTYDRDATESYMQLFRKLCSVDLLVLDDLGAERQTEWVLEQLFSIVNERWQDERTLVITTNVPGPDDDAVWRRFETESKLLRQMREQVFLDGFPGLLDRLDEQIETLKALETGRNHDPLARLRAQVGPRTVSRLVEICDDALIIDGVDRRIVAHGA